MNRLTVASVVLLALGGADLLLLNAHFAPRAFPPESGSGTVDPLPGKPLALAKNTPRSQSKVANAPKPGGKLQNRAPRPEPQKPAPAPKPGAAAQPDPETTRPGTAPDPGSKPAPEPAAKPAPVPESKPEPASPAPAPAPAPETKPTPRPARAPATRPAAPGKDNPIRIFFSTNSSRLTPQAKGRLIRLANLAKQYYPGARLRLDGHADRRGEQKYNMELGQARAAAAASFLEAMGIKPLRMIKRSFGSTIPLATQNTPAGWARNRRTEIYMDTRGRK